jgi:biopolymer transport protein TolQ
MENSGLSEQAGAAVVELTPWALFMHGDIISRVLMVILVVASVWSWAIILDKFIRMSRVRAATDAFENEFWSGGSLETLYDRVADRPDNPMAVIFVSAMSEWRRSVERGIVQKGLTTGLKERIDKVMTVTIGREMERLERFLNFLASVGSTAPFIGLMGTVWGIMLSFSAIASSKNNSLAVVAPGISHALFATLLGLVAAIPAVLAYNILQSTLSRYGNRLDGFADEFSAILSRQLDERAK